MLEQLFFNLVVFIGPLIFAVAVHEFAHVAMAYQLGDDTGKLMGRYTLDPTKHIDPVWTIALPAVLICLSTAAGGSMLPFLAAGRPAPYNPLKLRAKCFGKTIPLRFLELLVAIAGPLSNLLLAIISLLLILLLSSFGYDEVNGRSVNELLMQFVYLNISLLVFNMIPIPPLDGSKVLMAFLSREGTLRYEEAARSLSWVFLILILFGGGAVIGKVVHLTVRGMVWFLI